MSIILVNLQSNQQIKLDPDDPFIIGRGNVTGCFDKRVSRNHGKITCTLDGKIRLAALHCNPCFFARNGVPPIVQLNKDEEETLSEGDYLGLLPNAFWFKISSNGNIKIKEEIDSSRSDPVIEENIKTSIPTGRKSLSISCADKTAYNDSAKCIASDKHNEVNLNLALLPDSSNSSSRLGTPEFEKTRRLPIWMYEIDEPVEFSQKSSHKHSQLSCTEVKRKKRTLLSGSEIDEKPQTLDVKKVKNEVIDLDVPSTSKIENTNESLSAVIKPQTKVQSNVQTQGALVKEELCTESSRKEGYESYVENAGDSSTKRSICQYEGSCYRNNPQHKIEFCHPGDSDYVPYEERPACQYGADCFRRNQKHRVEFKHPVGSSSHNFSSSSCSQDSIASSPLPPKRRRKKIKTQNFDYESDDDFEDPFINNDSSDDYVPSDLDSE